MGGQCHALDTYPQEKDLVPILWESGLAKELVWMGMENLGPMTTVHCRLKDIHSQLYEVGANVSESLHNNKT